MCFNAEVSLQTFIFGSICAGISLLLGKYEFIKILTVFSFTSMQLLEYYAWTYINDKEKIRQLSVIALHLIAVQLILINVALPSGNIRLFLLTSLMFLFISFYLINMHSTKFDMEKGENGHLVWYWADGTVPIWIFLALLFYLIPCYFNRDGNILLFPFCFITIIISLYYYFKYKTWGTIWCYISNSLWFFIIIFSVLKIYKIIK